MKTTVASFITSLCLLVGSAAAEEQALENAGGNRGSAHLAQLTAQPWLADWKGATLEDIRLVEPKKDQAWPTGLPAVWRAGIVNATGETGYLAWDAGGEGKLVEFAFDANLLVDTPTAKALRRMSAFQQFPIPQKEGKAVASGCVPTSAASVLGYWIDRAYPQWRGDAGDDPLPPLTKHPPFAPLRSGPKAASKPSRQKQIPSSSSRSIGQASWREDIARSRCRVC